MSSFCVAPFWNTLLRKDSIGQFFVSILLLVFFVSLESLWRYSFKDRYLQFKSEMICFYASQVRC